MTTKATDVDSSIGPDEPENLIVFCANDEGIDAMLVEDFHREQLAEPRDPDEYAAVPATESGVPLVSEERLGEIRTQLTE